VVLFQPLQDALSRRLKGHASLCAGLSTVAVFLLILVPLAAVGWLVARECSGWWSARKALLEQVDLRRDLIANLPRGLRRHIRVESMGAETEQALLGVMTNGASVLKEVLGVGHRAARQPVPDDGGHVLLLPGRPPAVEECVQLIPLDQRYTRAFAQEFADVAHAIVYGNTVTALVQGALGLVGLMLVRVPHAGVWGAAMVLVALVPVGGTALIWFPIGMVLLLTGKVNEGVFLLAWGAFVVSSIDNVLRPKLCGSRMALHPLLVFLSMFGGLAVFGMMGLLVGPLIASLFMAMVRIYRRDFLKLAPGGAGGSGAGGAGGARVRGGGCPAQRRQGVSRASSLDKPPWGG
jgi:predicted PurR-regulated permease PerM